MFHKMITLAALAVFITQASAQPDRESRPIVPASIEVGQPFPVMMLPRIEDGLPDTLVNYRGQKLIMHIFASW